MYSSFYTDATDKAEIYHGIKSYSDDGKVIVDTLLINSWTGVVKMRADSKVSWSTSFFRINDVLDALNDNIINMKIEKIDGYVPDLAKLLIMSVFY